LHPTRNIQKPNTIIISSTASSSLPSSLLPSPQTSGNQKRKWPTPPVYSGPSISDQLRLCRRRCFSYVAGIPPRIYIVSSGSVGGVRARGALSGRGRIEVAAPLAETSYGRVARLGGYTHYAHSCIYIYIYEHEGLYDHRVGIYTHATDERRLDKLRAGSGRRAPDCGERTGEETSGRRRGRRLRPSFRRGEIVKDLFVLKRVRVCV